MIQESEDRASSDWRTYLTPFLNDNSIGLIRFLVRNFEDGENSNNDGQIGKNSPRFIVDINFSNLGRIQLDGLMKRNQKKNRLGDSLKPTLRKRCSKTNPGNFRQFTKNCWV